jgi:hypothetical protein
MTIIRFPGSPSRLPSGDTDPDPNHHLSIGPVSFTCTSCGQNTSADFHNMVFRSLEFYCLSCGHAFRLTNPAFTFQTKKQK